MTEGYPVLKFEARDKSGTIFFRGNAPANSQTSWQWTELKHNFTQSPASVDAVLSNFARANTNETNKAFFYDVCVSFTAPNCEYKEIDHPLIDRKEAVADLSTVA